MQVSRSSPGGPARCLVIGAALVVGAALALTPPGDAAFAADNVPAPRVAQADAPRTAAPAQQGPSSTARDADAPPASPGGAGQAAPASPPAADAPRSKARTPGDLEKEIEELAEGKDGVTIGDHGIAIQKDGKRVHVEGLGRDREYDSFEQFVQDAPWLAGLVFVTVLLVFLVPLLIIVLLVWYKIRKSRMANETMLKLAERGVVPPAAAMEAVATGNAAQMADAATVTPPAAPAYEHARALQRRTVWSDLRKGVILTGIGLGLTLWSVLDDGSPKGPGLIFLFVGVGYCLLWYFEDRTRTPQREPPVAPPPGS